MLIVGTGGLAQDLLTFLEFSGNKKLCFFNNFDTERKTLDGYSIIHTFEEVTELFKENNDFLVCVGNPLKRYRLVKTFEELGGNLVNVVIHDELTVHSGKFSKGIIVQPNCVIVKGVVVKKGVFINAGVIIGHDVVVNEYVSIGPGARILGHAEIGEYSYIGTNAVIMPGVKVGKKCRIGVGKIITEDVPDNSKII